MRAFLHIALPLLLPVLLYVVWVAIMRHRPLPEWWRSAPWPAMAATGLLLLALSLGLWAVLGGAPPGADYIPAQFEDGRVVPGRTVQ